MEGADDITQDLPAEPADICTLEGKPCSLSYCRGTHGGGILCETHLNRLEKAASRRPRSLEACLAFDATGRMGAWGEAVMRTLDSSPLSSMPST